VPGLSPSVAAVAAALLAATALACGGEPLLPAAFGSAASGGATASPGSPAPAPRARTAPSPPAARIAALGLARHPMAADEEPFFRTDGFLPVEPPTPDDWLANHAEPGQSFDEFVAARRATPTAERRRIYLVPVGELPISVDIDLVAAYLGAFFALEVVVAEPVVLALTTRVLDDVVQFRGEEVLTRLAERVPPDAALVLGVTAGDMYPADGWSFAYGLASYGRRVAMVSTARLAPVAPPRERHRGLHRRLLSIATHELGHALGVAHCVHYSCVMGGANHMAEVDAHPLQACPVDLRKLHRVLRFDLPARYRALAAALDRLGLEADAAWLRARLAATGAGAAGAARPRSRR
jgi:archaemetzincin